MWIYRIPAILGLAACAACVDEPAALTMTVSGEQIIASGEIDSAALNLFEETILSHPNATTLVLQHIGGSLDDEANLKFARIVRKTGLTTRVPSDGLVASGGTDLFLAGVNRVLETGACVGVHSWAADNFTATDLPQTDPEHDRYLDYYKAMGINAEFYWFTLQAAPADEMHWMTAEETAHFGLSGQQPTSLGTPNICDDR